MRDGDTIVALSSGAVPSGVAILRLSGPLAGQLLTELAGGIPPPRRLTLAALRVGGEIIDRGLIAWFPAPHSFTGEDSAELQVHGSSAVVRVLLRHLTSHPAVRLADAGEFTRRAFENGRLDLTEVEGLGDLIAAETEAQRRQAVARLDGALSHRLQRWRAALIDARAEIEARLDFADEGDVDAIVPSSVLANIGALRSEIVATLDTFEHGRIVREGFRVAIAGLPNVGKSSLLNTLSKSELAIVSDEAGTTRDVREVAMELGGRLVVLVDMAGLRETSSTAEAEGIRRARAEIAQADLVLWLVAPDVEGSDTAADSPAPFWRVATKVDLGGEPADADAAVSMKTGAGIDELMQRLKVTVEAATPKGSGLVSRERDKVALSAATIALAEAMVQVEQLEVMAEALRRASHALGMLLGEIDAEAVLDRLFAGFCIGK